MLCLVDIAAGSESAYEQAVTLFFDTVDFKVLQVLDVAGMSVPDEQQTAGHAFVNREKA